MEEDKGYSVSPEKVNVEVDDEVDEIELLVEERIRDLARLRKNIEKEKECEESTKRKQVNTRYLMSEETKRILEEETVLLDNGPFWFDSGMQSKSYHSRERIIMIAFPDAKSGMTDLVKYTNLRDVRLENEFTLYFKSPMELHIPKKVSLKQMRETCSKYGIRFKVGKMIEELYTPETEYHHSRILKDIMKIMIIAGMVVDIPMHWTYTEFTLEEVELAEWLLITIQKNAREYNVVLPSHMRMRFDDEDESIRNMMMSVAKELIDKERMEIIPLLEERQKAR